MPLNQKAMREREEKEEIKKGSGMGFEHGDNHIRVLPPNKDWFEKDIDRIDYLQWVHYNAGPEGSLPQLCLRDDAIRQRCPLCTLAKKVKDRMEGNKNIEKVYKSIVAKPQYWFNLFDVDHPDKGIQQRRLGPKIREPIHQVAGDRSYGDILNPATGRTFIINMVAAAKHQSGYNQYTVNAEGSPSSVKDLLPPKWGAELEKLKDELLKPITVDEMQVIAKEIEATVVAEVLGEESTGSGSGTQRTETKAPDNANTKAAQGDTPTNEDRTPADEGPPPAQDTPKDETPPPAGGKQPCFGETYEPGTPKCEACADKPACVNAFCGG